MTEDHIRKEKMTRLVKHHFTAKEKQAFGEELADAHARRTGAQNELDTLKKQIAARITQEDGAIAERVEKIRSGYEMRREPCTMIKNFQTCTIMVIRDSSGEILEERAMTSEESQLPLFDHQGETQEVIGDEAALDASWEAGIAAAETEADWSGDQEEAETEREIYAETKEGEQETAADKQEEPQLIEGNAYDIVVQGPKRKRTRKNLVFKETKTNDNNRVAYVFKDAAGRAQPLDADSILDIKAVGNDR